MALFDYSARLENVYQIETGSNPSWNNPDYIDTPDSDVFFQSVFNPGHDGSILFLEYYLQFMWYSETASETIAYEWQYKESGGSWTTFASGSASSSAATPGVVTETIWGIYTTSFDMPVEIRLIGTDADANWRVQVGDTYDLFLRAVGTVS